MMTKIEVGTLVALIVAISAGAAYIGRLEGRLDSISPENIQEVAKETVDMITKSKDQALKELESSPPLPSGTVLPYAGTQEIVPAGWVVCGQSSTPNMSGHFLVGTAEFGEVGTLVGSATHVHGVRITTGLEFEGAKYSSSEAEGADNYTGDSNWNHKHVAEGDTRGAEHMPPSMKVLFLCKK